VKWSRAHVVRISVSHPRAARPSAVSRINDSAPPMTSSPKRGGTKPIRPCGLTERGLTEAKSVVIGCSRSSIHRRTDGCGRRVSRVLPMDVVVCGAQMPFMRGGAELHMENLVHALEAAGHRADLVRLPTAWDRTRIFDSALAWRLAPIDADLVIATNFPSYFV